MTLQWAEQEAAPRNATAMAETCPLWLWDLPCLAHLCFPSLKGSWKDTSMQRSRWAGSWKALPRHADRDRLEVTGGELFQVERQCFGLVQERGTSHVGASGQCCSALFPSPPGGLGEQWKLAPAPTHLDEAALAIEGCQSPAGT